MNAAQVLYLVLTAIVAGGGAYFGSYLKKKGENLATHEDIDQLVNQVAAVTQTTKEIEAQISNAVWERQRKWEVRREALFEVTKELGSVEYGLGILVLTFSSAKQGANEKTAAGETWNLALEKFKRARVLALLVCGDELKESLDDFEKLMIAIVKETSSKDEIYPPWFPRFRQKMDMVIELVRKELYEVDALAHSTESSNPPRPEAL
jgi:hypothetical protein